MNVMEGSVYSNLGLKMNRTFKEKREEDIFTLKDLIDHKWVIHSSEELKKALSKELRTVLAKESLFELIDAFFELESNLAHVVSMLDFETAEINFDDFYKNFSPLLLRSIHENSSHPENSEQILRAIKESFRIALEEDVYSLENRI
jgi:hypothetical protein